MNGGQLVSQSNWHETKVMEQYEKMHKEAERKNYQQFSKRRRQILLKLNQKSETQIYNQLCKNICDSIKSYNNQLVNKLNEKQYQKILLKYKTQQYQQSQFAEYQKRMKILRDQIQKQKQDQFQNIKNQIQQIKSKRIKQKAIRPKQTQKPFINIPNQKKQSKEKQSQFPKNNIFNLSSNAPPEEVKKTLPFSPAPQKVNTSNQTNFMFKPTAQPTFSMQKKDKPQMMQKQKQLTSLNYKILKTNANQNIFNNTTPQNNSIFGSFKMQTKQTNIKNQVKTPIPSESSQIAPKQNLFTPTIQKPNPFLSKQSTKVYNPLQINSNNQCKFNQNKKNTFQSINQNKLFDINAKQQSSKNLQQKPPSANPFINISPNPFAGNQPKKDIFSGPSIFSNVPTNHFGTSTNIFNSPVASQNSSNNFLKPEVWKK